MTGVRSSNAIKMAKPWLCELEPCYERALPRGVIRLDLSESPLGPSPKVLEAISANLDAIGQYTRLNHVLELKYALAKYVSLGIENIAVFHGADAAIDCILKCFVNPGDSIVVPQPTYPAFGFFAKAHGAKPLDVYLKKPGFRLDMAEALRACRGAKAVFLCNPNNPTGNIVVGKAELKELLSCETLVFVDEAYFEFSGFTVSDLVRDFWNLGVIRSFSKAFGLPGLRVGYVLAPEEVIGALEKVRAPHEVSVLGVKAAVAALSDMEHLLKVVKLNEEGRAYLFNSLSSIEGVRPYESRANFLMFYVSPALSKAPELAAKLLEKFGVAIKDLSNFKGLGEGFLRVGVGKAEHNKLFVEALKGLLAGS